MRQQLSAKQYIPLSSDEKAVIQDEAQRRSISTGLFARALLLHAIDDLGHAHLEQAIEDEKTATKSRISDGARVAAQQRWGSNDEGKK